MKLRLLCCILFAMTFGLVSVQAQTQDDYISEQQPVKIGDEIDVRFRTVHPYESKKAEVLFEKEFYSKNSTYIKLYFRNFDLAPGDYVEIYSPKTEESLIYAGKGKIVDNGATTISDFWSRVIFSDKVIVKLHTVQASKGYGFDLETVAYGYSPERIVEIEQQQRRAICGGDEKERIACYDGTEMFNKAKAVCKLIMNGSGSCTGWLLGCEGNLMTNNHCIGNASTARNTDFLFNFQTNSCSGGNSTTDRVATSATFIKTSNSVDATIVQLPVNPTDTYGYLSLRSQSARAGERIYIPQHPGGRRKEIAVNEGSGLAKILRINGSRDLEYNTDTEGGSSGSPVLDYETNLVVGIHNTGGCPNGAQGGNRRLISWLGSDMPNCGLDDDNTGVQQPVSGFDVAVNCTGATFTSTSQNAESYSWNFGDGNTSTLENPTHTYSSAGQFVVTLTVSNSIGSNESQSNVTTQEADVPSPVSETVCPGESATITLPGDRGYIWYDQATGGNILGAGTTFETGPLTADTDYFVSGTSENVLEGSLGVENINATSGGNHQGGFYLVFDAVENIILRKAKVLAQGAGDRTLELRDSSGNIIETKVISIPDGENVINLDLRIEAGNDLQIGFADGANLFRNNANLNYPYIYNAFNTDIVTIKGSTASTPTGFYYYLYNWEINAVGNCETEERTKISVAVEELAAPTVQANQNTGVMTVGGNYDTYQWFLNGQPINGATSNTYTATENGTYSVQVSNGSCESNSEDIVFGTLSTDSFEFAGLSIYPNPVKEVLNIKGLNTLDDVKQLKVVNMLGQTVKTINLTTVLETTSLDVRALSNGLYFLNIDDKYTAKFVVK